MKTMVFGPSSLVHLHYSIIREIRVECLPGIDRDIRAGYTDRITSRSCILRDG
jgi:hypothetical protein